jgi:hypothetical protein
MASWAGITFDEIVTASMPLATRSTTPTIRLLAGGGELVTPGPSETTLSITVLTDTETLHQLREALAGGTISDLALAAETVANAQLVEIGTPVAVYFGDTWTVPLRFVGDVTTVTPQLGVNLDGVGIFDVLSVSTSVGRNTRFATATVNCAIAQGSRGQWVEIFGGAGGDVVALFKGQLETISESYYPGQATLTCVGTLKRLTRQWEHIEEYTGQEDSAMIVNFLEKRNGLHSIESSGLVLGERQPLLIQPGETFIQWVDEVDEVAGYRTYDRHDGAVYRRRDDPIAVGSASTTLTEGDKILSIRTVENYDAIRNRIIVTGLPFSGLQVYSEVEGSNGDLDTMMPGTAPNYNAHTIDSDLIETVEYADAIAARALGDLNRLQKALEVTVPFDPTLVVDDTVQVVAPSIGVNATCMIWDVQHAVDGTGGTTTIVTNGGTL